MKTILLIQLPNKFYSTYGFKKIFLNKYKKIYSEKMSFIHLQNECFLENNC
jgi:hypothetical protein